MHCPKCGQENQGRARFCTACGAKLTNEADRNAEELNIDNGIAVDGLYGEKSKDNRKESFLTKINRFHVLKFIYYQFKAKHFIMLLFFAAIFYAIYAISEGRIDGVFYNCLIQLVICHFFMNGVGQALLRLFMGARKIERYEYIENLQKPVEQIIDIVRNEGLDLPERINIYYCNSDQYFAYAVGMNSIVVSVKMIELRDDLFEAKIRTELYRINHMCPDYLLFVLGSNFIGLISCIFILMFAGLQKNYGSRSTSFWHPTSDSEAGAILYYLTFFIAIAWVGLCYIVIKSVIQTDILKADEYVADCGYGEAQCIYIDIVPESPYAKILEIGYPSADKRIAALQGMGVQYSNS